MISILIPVRNEEMCIRPITHEIIPVMNSVNLLFEIIFINDHSTDTTLSIAEKTAKEHPEVKVLSLVGENGKDAALLRGMHEAKGDILVTMDGDLQNDPSDIPRLLPMLEKYDMVCGVRRRRVDPVLKKAVSCIANRFRKSVAGGSISDAGCALRCMKRNCIASIERYNSVLFESAHYFYPDLVERHGGRVAEVTVKHRPRRYGKTKFNLIAGRVILGIRACLAVRRIGTEVSPRSDLSSEAHN
ncbi:MAG: glycosyltransferase family 2 protein [Chitinispirillaceae bacterium]|nr:glycosyltransferase family 2 protein [Chitinispirillaceae bacterium]